MERPLQAFANCQYPIGFSGEEKFKLSVTANGSAPTQLKFRAASATAAFPPRSGSKKTQRLGQSTTAAIPRLDDDKESFPSCGLNLIIAASAAPGGTKVLFCTW